MAVAVAVAVAVARPLRALPEGVPRGAAPAAAAAAPAAAAVPAPGRGGAPQLLAGQQLRPLLPAHAPLQWPAAHLTRRGRRGLSSLTLRRPPGCFPAAGGAASVYILY